MNRETRVDGAAIDREIAPDSREKVAALLGEKVTVNGKVDGDTVTIESAEAAK